MYQQLRLGALKINWQPPSERLAVGTIDDGIYAIQDDLLGQLPTTHIEGDRDKWLEQPAELEDVMYWEQENDDTGSEYNITDECTSEGEQGSLKVNFIKESECSVDEDENNKDGDSSKALLRRSKRKKRKAEGLGSHGRSFH
jgi:PH-interacting protein